MAVLTGYPEKSMVDFPLAKKIAKELQEAFIGKKVDQIDLLYTSYKAGGAGVNRIVPYLGLSYLMEAAQKDKNAPDFIFEPNLPTVFVSLLSRYLEGKMYSALLESLTSEYSARMIAMKQATDNAEEVLDDLKLLKNKTRQATITRELSEIVSGASVLV